MGKTVSSKLVKFSSFPGGSKKFTSAVQGQKSFTLRELLEMNYFLAVLIISTGRCI